MDAAGRTKSTHVNITHHSSRDIDDARSLGSDLIEIFTFPQRGQSDADTLEEVRRICQIAAIAIDDSRCHAQLRDLERFAGYFFLSDDQEVCWAWHTACGHARLRGLILRLLRVFELRLRYLRTYARSADVLRVCEHAAGSTACLLSSSRVCEPHRNIPASANSSMLAPMKP